MPEPYNPLTIYVFAGPSGSGKTELGSRVAKEMGYPFIDIDKTREELFPEPPHIPPGTEKLPYLQAEDRALQLTHPEIQTRAENYLKKGENPVVAQTFRSLMGQEIFESLAKRHNANLLVVQLTAPLDVLLSRVTQRDSSHQVTTKEQLKRQLEGFKTYPKPHIQLDTAAFSPEAALQQVLSGIRAVNSSRSRVKQVFLF